MEKKAGRLANLAEADRADRDFYKKLTGNERLKICLELSGQDADPPLERIAVIRKLSGRAT